MSRKHSTLLKEEIDDDEGSGGDKKKREKDKDGVERKKKSHKKGAERSEGYYNDSMTKSAKAKSAAITTAAVNPEMVTSPVHSQPQGVIPPPLQPPPQSHQGHRHQVVQQNYSMGSPMPNAQGYGMAGVQGQVGAQQIPIHNQQVMAGHWQQQTTPQRLLPPPGTQHVQMVQQPFQQMQSSQPPHPQAQFAPKGQHPQQQVQHPQQQVQHPQQQVQHPQQQVQHPQQQVQHPQQQVQHPQQQVQHPQQQVQHPQQQVQHPQQQVQHPQQQVQHPQQQAQVYQPHPSQPGYYTVVQYPHGVTAPNQMAGQVVGYQGHPVVHPGMVHVQPVLDDQGNVWHPVAPQSPTNQGQAQQEQSWPQHNEGNWAGHPAGPIDPNWHPGGIPGQDQQRDGNWAAFDGSPPETKAQIPNRKEITWRESPDNSSSDEEIERSSSPELAGEEGEGLLRAPSLTSFAESTSSIEDEGEENPWKIHPEQHDYYTKQFKRLQPDDGGVIKGPKARDFFLKSSLPTETLSKIWHLSDINKDNALDLDEFCIAMHLVVALRHGLELPTTLPDILLHHRSKDIVNDHLSGERGSPLQENSRHENMDSFREDHSVPKPIPFRDSNEDLNNDSRPRSLSDPSINDDHPEVSRKSSMPSSTVSKLAADGTLSPGPTVSIERPRAAAKFSLLDSLPGQLLPPPSGKFSGWTPSKADRRDSYSGESDEDSDEEEEEEEESRPMSPGQAMPVPIPIPIPPVEEDNTPKSPQTPPASPRTGSPIPPPVLPDPEQVTRRLSKKSERPRSAGDLNDVKPLSQDDSSGSTPTNSSIGSDGKKEPPPPPPPRNKKGHSRSSSLDLNKLFASKGKESRANTIGSPTSSQSSQTSQNSDITISSKAEPKVQEKEQETRKSQEEVAKEENFADFSNFENLVKQQETTVENQMDVPAKGRAHRRSLSLDQGQDYVPKLTKPNNNEAVARTSNEPAKVKEALPRPVPKLKPPGSPPVKLLKLHDRTPKKEGSEERKLKTEPPKVIVKPLTKEGKLQNSIRDLKDKNLLLSRLNSELQEESKAAMEQRISLELKLERLKPFGAM